MRGFLVVFAVLAAAIGLGVGFFAINLGAAPVHLPTTTDLEPRPLGSAWTPIEHGGQPPQDVLTNLVLPARASVTGYTNIDANAAQYDRRAIFFVPAGVNDVVGFYAAELPALGWKIRGAAATRDHRGRTILAYRFSHDTFEWQIQVSAEPALRDGRSGTRLSLEAYQQDDMSS